MILSLARRNEDDDDDDERGMSFKFLNFSPFDFCEWWTETRLTQRISMSQNLAGTTVF